MERNTRFYSLTHTQQGEEGARVCVCACPRNTAGLDKCAVHGQQISNPFSAFASRFRTKRFFILNTQVGQKSTEIKWEFTRFCLRHNFFALYLLSPLSIPSCIAFSSPDIQTANYTICNISPLVVSRTFISSDSLGIDFVCSGLCACARAPVEALAMENP